MKNIVILTSIGSPSLKTLAGTFNSGERFKIALVATDRENSPALDEADALEIEKLVIPREVWRETPEEIIEILKEKGINAIVLDRFLPLLDDKFAKAFPGKIIDIEKSVPEETPRKITEFLTDTHSVDRQWAAVLGLDFDPEKAQEAIQNPIPPAIPSDAGQTQSVVPPQQPEHFEINEEQPSFPKRPEPYQQPQPYQQAYGSQQPPLQGTPFYNQPGQAEPMPSTFLLWSILSTIFCCFIPGIVAIVFSSMVSSKYYARDYEGSRKASRMAEIWIIVSIVLGVVSAPFYWLMLL